MRLIGIYKISFDIFVLTGIHIGGLVELEIGGIDNPVIKDIYGTPYIPGSSLKGKMRSLLEMKNYCNGGNSCVQLFGQDPCKCGVCKICVLFGCHDAKKSFISRLIFSDAPLKNKEEIEKFNEGLLTELKMENRINRLSGTAGDPRKTERVPPGAIFSGEVKYLVFDTYKVDKSDVFDIEWEENEGDKKVKKKIKIPSDVDAAGKSDCNEISKNLSVLLEGLELVESTYLGGSGTRGYGKVMFCNLKIDRVSIADSICSVDQLKRSEQFARLYEKFAKSGRDRLEEDHSEMKYLIDILGIGSGTRS